MRHRGGEENVAQVKKYLNTYYLSLECWKKMCK